MAAADALLLDIDGVLTVSWEPLPGAVDAMAWIRRAAIPFRLITNTTTHTRRELARTLAGAGFDVAPDEIVTAVVATASYLRGAHAGARVFALTDGDPGEDLEDMELVDAPADAEVIVLGGACDAFTYAAMNAIFGRLMDGVPLVGMHRNLFWKTSAGWELDGGAYIAGLEEASGVTAAICGKPARAYFEAALEPLGVPAARAAMVGDDIVNDVIGAQAVGLTGVLVRTGKFRGPDVAEGTADVVLDALADVPRWLEGA
jgi:HAD superfamily hydrolase (TIGR01458 family)